MPRSCRMGVGLHNVARATMSLGSSERMMLFMTEHSSRPARHVAITHAHSVYARPPVPLTIFIVWSVSIYLTHANV